eukprot:3131144-Amphidinium_carterae.2
MVFHVRMEDDDARPQEAKIASFQQLSMAPCVSIHLPEQKYLVACEKGQTNVIAGISYSHINKSDVMKDSR